MEEEIYDNVGGFIIDELGNKILSDISNSFKNQDLGKTSTTSKRASERK
jgi:hypothetical protein